MDYLVIDLETTGLDGKRDEIIEIGAVLVRDGATAATFQTLVKPQQAINEQIEQLTGINDELVAAAPCLDEAMARFMAFAGSCRTYIAHNASFERSFLQRHLSDTIEWLDTIELARLAAPTLRSYSLNELLHEFELTNQRPHRALEDAQATADLFLLLGQRLNDFPAALWRKLIEIFSRVKSPLATYLAEIATAATAKMMLFSEAGDSDYCPADDSLWNNKKNDGRSSVNTAYRLPTDKISAYFAADGQVASVIPGFEARAEQVQMSLAVAAAINDKHFLLAEAGTGTGKSLAYLLPGTLFAVGSRLPLVISTHTINLQEQLWHKDIPLVRQAINREDLRFALVKGRGNYLCLRKWRDFSRSAKENNLAFILRLAVWLHYSKTGDGSEMNLHGQDKERWNELAAHSETCSMGRCPYGRNRCFVQQVRKAAEVADVMVVNHSLLLSHCLLKKETGVGILPEFSYLVIDEAHNLDQVAEEQMTKILSPQVLDRALYSLSRREKNRQAGRIHQLLTELAEKDGYTDAYERAVEVKVALAELSAAAKEMWRVFDSLLEGMAAGVQLRIKPENKAAAGEKIEGVLSNFIFTARKLNKENSYLIEELGKLDDPHLSVDSVGDLKMAGSGIFELMYTAQAIVDCDLEQSVIWLDYNAFMKQPVWHVAPVAIAQTLQDCLYDTMDSVILTSATLSGNDKFAYFKSSLGLTDEKYTIELLQLNSPFDYLNQAALALYSDLPDYNGNSELVVTQAIADVLVSLITAAKGRTLVLFTSHQQLKQVYNLINAPLKQQGIDVLAHGISGNRNTLLHALRQQERTCLLGASSFWEGVDITGEALSLVIAVRLPFLPPNSPTMEARFERMEANGQNPFRKCSLPQAVIRFKQGFGRLIRTNEDKGIFCVLDRRIWEKNYGKSFLHALPSMNIVQGNKEELRDFIEKWL